jgi:hypothetical protein
MVLGANVPYEVMDVDRELLSTLDHVVSFETMILEKPSPMVYVGVYNGSHFGNSDLPAMFSLHLWRCPCHGEMHLRPTHEQLESIDNLQVTPPFSYMHGPR